MKAALFVPRQVRETLQTSYYLPAKTLAEKAKTLIDFYQRKKKWKNPWWGSTRSRPTTEKK